MFLRAFLFLFVPINLSYGKIYRNYTLYRGVPVAQDHIKFFEDLPKHFDINFWRESKVLWKPIEFVISPKDRNNFENLVDLHGMYLTTLAEDVQSILDKSAIPEEKFKSTFFGWKNYHKLEDIYSWLKSLTSNSDVKVFSIGETVEKRPIMAVHLLFPGVPKRPKVIVEGGIHAREWISVSFVTFMIDQLIKGTNEEVQKIRSAYEFFFVPVLNPDGYVYSTEKDRLWRKNRNYGGFGVDLNRNFDAMFGAVGSSKNYTSEKYCGPHTFSEKETIAMRTLVEAHSKELGYYLSFHSYGQNIVIPYLYSVGHSENFDEMKRLGQEAANRLYKRYNTTYTVGTSSETVGYLASGASTCWAKKKFNVPVVLLFELRDTGKFGFALPPELITPTCEETFDGILTILKTNTGLQLRKDILQRLPTARTTNKNPTTVHFTTTTTKTTKIETTILPTTHTTHAKPVSTHTTYTIHVSTNTENNPASKKLKKRRGKKRRKHERRGENGQRIVDVNIYMMSLFTFVFSSMVV